MLDFDLVVEDLRLVYIIISEMSELIVKVLLAFETVPNLLQQFLFFCERLLELRKLLLVLRHLLRILLDGAFCFVSYFLVLSVSLNN